MIYMLVASALAFGNAVCIPLLGVTFERAAERTFFQWVAILVLFFAQRLTK